SHSPEEAMRILNQSLEPLGYRLQRMGRYLVVVEIRKTRQEYPRHTVASNPEADPGVLPLEEAGELAPAGERLQPAPTGSSRGPAVSNADHTVSQPLQVPVVEQVSGEQKPSSPESRSEVDEVDEVDAKPTTSAATRLRI